MADVSVRALLLDLMVQLKNEFYLTYLFITHDLATAKYICDRIGILYLGRMAEIGDLRQVMLAPFILTHKRCWRLCQCLIRISAAPSPCLKAKFPIRSTPTRLPLPPTLPVCR